MIRIAVVEDNEQDLRQIVDKLLEYQKEHGSPLEISTFSNGMELMTHYKPIYDLLILDIEMPLMDGISVANRVREVDKMVQILFLTNMAQYALKGYEVEAKGHILKPISYFALVMEMKKIERTIGSQSKRSILLAGINETKRILVDEITYVEINNHQLIFHTLRETSAVTGSLKSIERDLAQNGFASCNRCHLVNMRYVERVEKLSVVVAGETLSISRNRRKAFLNALNAYYGGWTE